MSKSLVLGNGNILVGFDKFGQVSDFYSPRVGLENQMGKNLVHKVGVFVDGRFSWISDGEWGNTIKYKDETLASDIRVLNKSMEIEINFLDVVYNEKDIFIRKAIVKNLSSRKREVKIFFHQQFNMYGNSDGDTGYYDPDRKVIVHYEGRRVFIIGGLCDNNTFDDYSIGVFAIEGKEGTWKDAEDGVLDKNPVEHGLVDSVISFNFEVDANKEKEVVCFISASTTLKKAQELHDYVLEKTPGHLIETTQDFWKAWVNKSNFNFFGLKKDVSDLFKKSLLIIRTHIDNEGAVIASCDSDMLQNGRDTYAYMWPRDAAFTVLSLDKAGYNDIARRFFSFCNDIISTEGYFFHKYRSDKSIGSSWHPWIRNGKKQLAIQEDETALVLYSLWEHYKISKDLEFIESIYNSLIKKSAEFLIEYRNHETHLPHESYDLWEEKYGVSTFTASAVYGALVAASNFAELLGKEEDAKSYELVALDIKQAIIKHLYNKEERFFYKLMDTRDGDEIYYDPTIDASSFYGVFRFGVLDKDDKMLRDSYETLKRRLFSKTEVDGVFRYEGDRYYQVGNDAPSNPWFITTLWIVEYQIALAKDEKDLEEVKKWFDWAVRHTLPSGIMSEQINTYTGEQLSAAPLTWSHAEFVLLVEQYLEKLEEMGICKACNPIE
ncbi:MAG: glycoside hydrolase family 15 [Parcubacteria group bacterium CG10_big_fil_rev_8_21_14_0_10_38_31]|nr:MAG: glycoside hydrolase family 15 [Parcubacteria group bacterium CG10_big_fil_rev_8_21_14_0_10_38_31]